MNITVLDSDTLGEDLDLSAMYKLGKTEIFSHTNDDEICERIKKADIIVINKVKLTREKLVCAANAQMICVMATGFDNVDTEYCRERGIVVCNVRGYSTKSVALVTVASALSLYTHIREYNRYVESGEYSKSGMATCVYPYFSETENKVWGVMGLGNIGREVYKAAEALGFTVMGYSRTPKNGFRNEDIYTLCKESDILSIHLPLNEDTRHIINLQRLKLMKKNAVIVNMARGSVVDEEVVVEAIEKGIIGGFACDVYSEEPFSKEHPYNRIMNMDNVCLTPHMAWGAYDARKRCLDEVIKNIKAFTSGSVRNRVV